MTEALHVACAIRDRAALLHGVQMRNVAEKLPCSGVVGELIEAGISLAAGAVRKLFSPA